MITGKNKSFQIINGFTKRYGIIGSPLIHTKSPIMHNMFFIRNNINAIYFPFEIDREQFLKTVPFLRTLFKGFNVTVPYKEEIFPCLDRVTKAASFIGAVNTVFFEGSSWMGGNTDWQGFLDNIQDDYDISFANKTVLLLGAGGSTRACAYAAIQGSAKKIIIANRTLSKAENIINSFKCFDIEMLCSDISKESLLQHIDNADIIVNTTSIGLDENDRHYVDFTTVREKTFVYDLIYSIETDFLKRARAKGCLVGSGLGMLVRQGAYAQKIWNDITPDIEKMKSDIS